MKNIRIVMRADDLGSSHSANLAIESVVNAGFVKNVSVMACGPFAAEAARLLAGRGDVCFGMHTTLNSEWDRVKWGPVLTPGKGSGLVDSEGYFLSAPSMFLRSRPRLETVMAEVAAQLECLRSLGFDIKYIDSHMFSEVFIDGLDEAMEAFARAEGLLDHMYYYRLPPPAPDLTATAPPFSWLPSGQYFCLSHPSLDTEEMRMTGNSRRNGADIAAARAAEAAVYSDPAVIAAMGAAGVHSVRYDEAQPGKRLTVEELGLMFNIKNVPVPE